MENKEFKIVPPEGYEIDKENSTFECIKLKKKSLTYEDVAKELFRCDTSYYIDSTGNILNSVHSGYYRDPNTAISKKQLEKLLAINMLMNVAKYLNGDWKPNWEIIGCDKWYFQVDKNEIEIMSTNNIDNYAIVYFKSKELAKQAIDILEEDIIHLALSTDW